MVVNALLLPMEHMYCSIYVLIDPIYVCDASYYLSNPGT